jgi:hypothetical protein
MKNDHSQDWYIYFIFDLQKTAVLYYDLLAGFYT